MGSWEDTEDGLWPDALPAMRAFLAVSTQWRAVGGMGPTRFIGLDYASARAGLEAEAIEVTPAIWADLRLIEVGALEALNEDRT
ncbi:DUF1799 domain-containing protein [Frigidibacter oleivorans]|uniref:DUF1799 domain-containing protein n=1 Tax=Frigidibacter oleivorans TaxID=2487129 RepID=UPI0022A71ACC|nr:DUF1799 domain-containing protein [Frigidibacter oleivorans]